MTYSMRQAGVSDQSAALKLIDAYYREQDARDISEKTQSALTLLNNPQLGVIWLIETAGDAVGYMVICFGYSIECGHDAFVDELFVWPGHRDCGAWQAHRRGRLDG